MKYSIWFIDSLFCLLTIPLTPISSGMNCTGWPVSLMSCMSDEYFSVLCSLAWSSLSSHGTVSSMMVMDGFPEGEAKAGSMITMSGFSDVTRISGGIVPPPIVWPWISE